MGSYIRSEVALKSLKPLPKNEVTAYTHVHTDTVNIPFNTSELLNHMFVNLGLSCEEYVSQTRNSKSSQGGLTYHTLSLCACSL